MLESNRVGIVGARCGAVKCPLLRAFSGGAAGAVSSLRVAEADRQGAAGTAARALRLVDRGDALSGGHSPPRAGLRPGRPARSHRALRDHRQAGPGRDGHRVFGARRAAGARRGREDDEVAGRRRDRAQALLARGAGRGERQPPERLPALRDRRGRRRAVHRHGAARGRGAGRAPAARAAERVRGAADRPRDPGRAPGVARPRHRPPRPQAVQRLPDPPRREAARLRSGAAERSGAGALAQLGHRADAAPGWWWAPRATWRPSR